MTRIYEFLRGEIARRKEKQTPRMNGSLNNKKKKMILIDFYYHFIESALAIKSKLFFFLFFNPFLGYKVYPHLVSPDIPI